MSLNFRNSQIKKGNCARDNKGRFSKDIDEKYDIGMTHVGQKGRLYRYTDYGNRKYLVSRKNSESRDQTITNTK